MKIIINENNKKENNTIIKIKLNIIIVTLINKK